jgi:hypothetical protein
MAEEIDEEPDPNEENLTGEPIDWDDLDENFDEDDSDLEDTFDLENPSDLESPSDLEPGDEEDE